MQIDRTILEIIEERSIGWCGRVVGITNERIPNRILNWEEEGKKKETKRMFDRLGEKRHDG